MAKILLKDVKHVYRGNVEAVKGVTLEIPDGIPIALLGPSGCGKTTLMKIIAGLIVPTEGQVYFDETDVTNIPPNMRNVGMVFQFPVVYNMSVFDNIAFPLKCAGYPSDKIKNRVKEISELIGLSRFLDLNGLKLNPADRQRVALARALAREELNVLILDEPLTNIPPEERAKMRILLKALQKKFMYTSIFVTHDQSEAFTFAKKVAVMKEGRILQYDELRVLFERPANTFVGFFVGSPGMNILTCKLEENKLNFASFSLPISEKLRALLEQHGNEFKVGIRPEYIKLSKSEVPNGIRLKCIVKEFIQNVYILTLSGDGVEIVARTNNPEFKEGEYLWAVLHEDKLRIYDRGGENLIF